MKSGVLIAEAMQMVESWDGPDRRRNKLFVTLNTEYHVHGDVCVGVRDRRSGAWLSGHRVLGGRLLGGFSVNNAGTLVPEPLPREGNRLVFYRDRRDVITSAVEQIARPPKDALPHYQIPS